MQKYDKFFIELGKITFCLLLGFILMSLTIGYLVITM